MVVIATIAFTLINRRRARNTGDKVPECRYSTKRYISKRKKKEPKKKEVFFIFFLKFVFYINFFKTS